MDAKAAQALRTNSGLQQDAVTARGMMVVCWERMADADPLVGPAHFSEFFLKWCV